MDDAEVVGWINELARGARAIRRESHAKATDADRERVRRLQVMLDQCWDRLRRRRARRAVGLDPGDAQLRDEETVEGYTG